MSAMVLTLRRGVSGPIDLVGITPDRLAAAEPGAIGAMRLASGRRLDEIFNIADGDPGELVIRADGAGLLRAGGGMRSGMLTIDGDAGDHAGQGMRGGTLVIMGNAGDCAGAPLPGDRQGMRGGILMIHGNAGDRTGERMRRGLILVGGNAGAWTGANMLAGTVAIAGECGPDPGLGLKRGSLILLRPPIRLPATFNDSGTHDLLFLTLLQRQLRSSPALSRFPDLDRRMRRYCGDMACGGTGEILQPA